eukprot:1143953-Pelagomonas_calceolata.AAC.1
MGNFSRTFSRYSIRLKTAASAAVQPRPEMSDDVAFLVLPSELFTHEAPVHFYKVKSHDGILGNEGAEALALQAAMLPHEADTSLNQAENHFFHLNWLATPVKKPRSHTELWVLPKLQDKLK